MISPSEQARRWILQFKMDPIAAAQIKNHISTKELIDLLELPVIANDDLEQILCGQQEEHTHKT